MDVCFFNDRSPFSHLEAQKRGKLVGSGTDYYGTALFEFVFDRWRSEGRNRIGVNSPDNLLSCLRRNEECRPCSNLRPEDAGLCRRREIGCNRQPVRGEHRERA